MKTVPNHTEAEVLEAIEKCVSLLAPTFTFGYYDVDDIKQEGRRFAIELLEKDRYDPGRPIENFLYTHIRNRLINLKRDKYRRSDSPCGECYYGRPCSPEGFCEPYLKWYDRNAAKASIMQPAALSYMEDCQVSPDSDVDADVVQREAVRLLDENMSPELRMIWHQMKAGIRLHKSKRERVKKEINRIMGWEKPEEEEEDLEDFSEEGEVSAEGNEQGGE